MLPIKNNIFHVLILISFFSACHTPVQKVNPVTAKNLIEQEILTYTGIDSVIDSFEKIPFEKLDRAYIKLTGYDKEIYRKGIAGKMFYKITGKNSTRYLVGKFRVIDFLPKDSTGIENIALTDNNKVKYLCIDREILYRFLDLINALGKKGCNKYGFKIRDGFRYPYFNYRTGGAGLSQHMFGKAIDLAVSDIDGDGKFTEAIDKRIVYYLLDTLIIKSSGGLGRYPGTNVVHFDSRGYKARW